MICRTYCYFLQVILFAFANGASIQKEEFDDNYQYSDDYKAILPARAEDLLKQDKTFWFSQGSTHLKHVIESLQQKERHVSKNVIFFVGDGMGATTATAARIYKGQRNGKMGEEHTLSFEEFPHVALVKTYNVDKQVPDSASTATALFTGVKSRYKTLGLDAVIKFAEFDKETYNSSKLNSFMVWAQDAGKHTGIVTTTRITHATPAATYSRIHHRDWECDTVIPQKYQNDIKDIARQLIEDEPGRNFKVILGGGLEQMGHASATDKIVCSRGDNLNLTEQWLKTHKNAKFVTSKSELNKVPGDVEHLLGLFAQSHLPYETVRQKHFPEIPSLTEMTRAAIEVLKKSPNGFVLMVEGGLIDRAHHSNFARLAMEETSELDNAVALALKETGPDTLIIVTSDHSHGFTLNGYPDRGNDILGFANDTKPYLTLSYANGPGFSYHYRPQDTTQEGFPWRNEFHESHRLTDPFYQHVGTFYRFEDTHGGEDVPIYAKGPGSYLIRGVIEQNYVAHAISYAACIGPHAVLNKYCDAPSEGSLKPKAKFLVCLVLIYRIIFM